MMTIELYLRIIQKEENEKFNHSLHLFCYGRCGYLTSRKNTMNKPNLEYDLLTSEYITQKCKTSIIYAQNLYSSLCNNLFYKNNQEWHCSWRTAGRIVSNLKEVGDYLDYYCSGLRAEHGDDKDGYVGEGVVKDEIRDDLNKLGWTIKQNEEEYMKPNIEVSIEGKPVKIELIPSAYQQGDEIMIQLKNSDEYEERLNDQITLYKDVKTNEIIGIKVHYLDKND